MAQQRADRTAAWYAFLASQDSKPATGSRQPAQPATQQPAVQPAAFQAQQPAEGWSAYGWRTLQYVLVHDVTWTVDLAGLDAAADAVNQAVSAPDISGPAIERLHATQRMLRTLAAARRDAAQAQPAAAQTTQPAAQAPPGGANGGGGSRVPVPVAPRPQPPQPARLPVPVASRPASSQPAAVQPASRQPAPRPVDIEF